MKLISFKVQSDVFVFWSNTVALICMDVLISCTLRWICELKHETLNRLCTVPGRLSVDGTSQRLVSSEAPMLTMVSRVHYCFGVHFRFCDLQFWMFLLWESYLMMTSNRMLLECCLLCSGCLLLCFRVNTLTSVYNNCTTICLCMLCWTKMLIDGRTIINGLDTFDAAAQVFVPCVPCLSSAFRFFLPFPHLSSHSCFQPMNAGKRPN